MTCLEFSMLLCFSLHVLGLMVLVYLSSLQGAGRHSFSLVLMCPVMPYGICPLYIFCTKRKPNQWLSCKQISGRCFCARSKPHQWRLCRKQAALMVFVQKASRTNVLLCKKQASPMVFSNTGRPNCFLYKNQGAPMAFVKEPTAPMVFGTKTKPRQWFLCKKQAAPLFFL